MSGSGVVLLLALEEVEIHSKIEKELTPQSEPHM